MKHEIVSRITEGAFRYQAWPTVTKGTDGTLYVGTSGHRLAHIDPFGKDLMYVSHDEGKSWTCPMIINDTWLDDRDAGLLAWGEGNLLLTFFNHPAEKFYAWERKGRPHYDVESALSRGMRDRWEAMAEELRPAGSWTRISRDNGKTWSPIRRAPVTSPHGPCLLGDGVLLYVGSVLGGNGTIEAHLSHDDGETWEYLSTIPRPADGNLDGHYEPYALLMANGDVLVAVRYQDITVPGKLRIYTTISHDQGKTWEESHFLDLLGAPAHMIQHSSGAVVMVYSRRCEPMGQYARVSHDFGKTWGKDVLIGPEAPDWDHGYPSSVELKNGDILTVYYQKYGGDSYNSILSTRWNLSEIE
ncbi:MAG: exo-alpha-sialidase [Clostridia bacterium]|nr:exo-alpha-sialidase [Clostridia bacterium]